MPVRMMAPGTVRLVTMGSRVSTDLLNAGAAWSKARRCAVHTNCQSNQQGHRNHEVLHLCFSFSESLI